MLAVEMPQDFSIDSDVEASAPTPATVLLNLGAGAGCTTPSVFTNVPRAALCGCIGASSQSNPGAKHASVPSSNSHHAARVRVANKAARRAFKSGHALNNQLLRAVLADERNFEIVTFDDAALAPAGMADLAPAW